MQGQFTDEELRAIYRTTKTIAVVGASANPDKAANRIPRYLQSQGYDVIPVNPNDPEILGRKTYAALADIAQPADVVDVFRPPQEAEQVARSAVAAGARVLWFQPGTHTDAAVALARAAGLEVIYGICMGETHHKLGLGPGPHAPFREPAA